MDSDLKLVLEEFMRMLCAEIREAFSNSMRAAEHVPVCSPPFVPAPEVEVVDDGPSFDGEPFVSPVFDVAPGFDHATATVLNFATSAHAIHDQADPDDVPVFDTTSDCVDSGPIFDEERFVATEFYSDPVAIAAFVHESRNPSRVDADFDDGPLFDEAPEDLTFAKLSIPDSVFMATTTTTGALVTCSTECPSGAINTTALDNTVLMEVVDLPDMVFNSCYTGVKGLGCCKVPCLASGRLHIGASRDVTPSEVHTRTDFSDVVAIDEMQQKLRDPGLLHGSVFIEFVRYCADFYWDPGSPESLQSIELSRAAAADCAPAYLLGFPVSWFTQRKCGDCPGRNMTYHVLACGTYCAQLQHIDMRYSIVEIDSTVGGQLEAMFVHKHLSKSRTYLLAVVDNWGHSYVRTGDWICLQKDLDDLVLVYALLQLSVALFSECSLSDILFSGSVELGQQIISCHRQHIEDLEFVALLMESMQYVNAGIVKDEVVDKEQVLNQLGIELYSFQENIGVLALVADNSACMVLVPAQWHFSVEFSDYGVSLLEIQLLEVPGRNLDWHMHACHLLQFVGSSTQLPGGIIDLVHKLQCSVYSVPSIGTLLGCIAIVYLKLVLAACANLLRVTKCWIVAPVQAQVTALKSRTRLNSRADGIYIQSSRGVVVIFHCLIWLFEYNMILFKCFDHNSTVVLYLTWDPRGLVYDWCGLLHKLSLDQCFQFENSYKKASKMDWLNELQAWWCFRSITLGVVVYALWLKWNSLGLECRLDIAFSVPGLRNTGNIATLSAKEVPDYHGDKLHFSVGSMQASESSNLKVRCLIMVSQLLTTEDCEMCCQITKRNMLGPWHPGDVLQAIVDLSERIHGQQGYVVTQFFQARLITKQLHWINITEEVFVREHITHDVVSMPRHQEHMHHIQEIYKEHQDQINSSVTGTCELQMEVPFHLKLVKTNQIYSSALLFDRWQVEWFFGDVSALGRGHLVYDQSSLLLNLPQNHDGDRICPGSNLRKQKNQA